MHVVVLLYDLLNMDGGGREGRRKRGNADEARERRKEKRCRADEGGREGRRTRGRTEEISEGLPLELYEYKCAN